MKASRSLATSFPNYHVQLLWPHASSPLPYLPHEWLPHSSTSIKKFEQKHPNNIHRRQGLEREARVCCHHLTGFLHWIDSTCHVCSQGTHGISLSTKRSTHSAFYDRPISFPSPCSSAPSYFLLTTRACTLAPWKVPESPIQRWNLALHPSLYQWFSYCFYVPWAHLLWYRLRHRCSQFDMGPTAYFSGNHHHFSELPLQFYSLHRHMEARNR